MKRLFVWSMKVLILLGIVAMTVLLAWAFQSRTMPALRVWHTASLTEEFTAGDAKQQSSLKDYLDREERLYRELHEKVYGQVKPTEDLLFSRYRKGGPQDPEWPERNWNRTFELVPENIQGGALLLHGLTDSPYSLRRIGEILYSKGFYILGLRLPGHGTIPGALTSVHWEDWVAASRIGARHVRERVGSDRPLVIAGYSNGGGLAVKYCLDALFDSSLPRPDQMLLFSPEIGIEPLAVISNSHYLLSFLPYFAKFKWLSIEPEYDPFKYNSFPKNAAQQAYELTAELQNQIKKARNERHFADFPPVLTFISWIDATVKNSATIQRFYNQLENQDSELVIFDVNRIDRLTMFIPEADEEQLKQLTQRSDLPYRLTVIDNLYKESEFLAERTKAPRSSSSDASALHLSWPRGVYSLSHLAVQFPPDDPVYGAVENSDVSYRGLPLGKLQPRGETRFLTVSLSQLLRIRSNPFFSYVERSVAAWSEDLLDRNGGHLL